MPDYLDNVDSLIEAIKDSLAFLGVGWNQKDQVAFQIRNNSIEFFIDGDRVVSFRVIVY